MQTTCRQRQCGSCYQPLHGHGHNAKTPPRLDTTTPGKPHANTQQPRLLPKRTQSPGVEYPQSRLCSLTLYFNPAFRIEARQWTMPASQQMPLGDDPPILASAHQLPVYTKYIRLCPDQLPAPPDSLHQHPDQLLLCDSPGCARVYWSSTPGPSTATRTTHPPHDAALC